MVVDCECVGVVGKECGEDDSDGRKVAGLYANFEGNDVVYIREYCCGICGLVGYVFSYSDYLFCKIVRLISIARANSIIVNQP